jgi:hypothetical protein
MADNVLRASNGWYLYFTYCQLDIRHADPTELPILDDYSAVLVSEIKNDAGHLSHVLLPCLKMKSATTINLLLLTLKGTFQNSMCKPICQCLMFMMMKQMAAHP